MANDNFTIRSSLAMLYNPINNYIIFRVLYNGWAKWDSIYFTSASIVSTTIELDEGEIENFLLTHWPASWLQDKNSPLQIQKLFWSEH